MFDVLARIEKENEKERVWIVGRETGRLLHFLLRVLQPAAALEIGTSVGYSAIWMGAALQENGKGQLWTIESHGGRFERAQKNIAEAGLEDFVMQVKGHAPEVISLEFGVPDELDFAFFDATKNEHELYFDAVLPRMQKGGMIAVDNVLSHGEEMAGFLEKLAAREDLEVVTLHVGSGLLLARVK